MEHGLVGSRAAISRTPLKTHGIVLNAASVVPLPSRFRRPFIPVSNRLRTARAPKHSGVSAFLACRVSRNSVKNLEFNRLERLFPFACEANLPDERPVPRVALDWIEPRMHAQQDQSRRFLGDGDVEPAKRLVRVAEARV